MTTAPSLAGRGRVIGAAVAVAVVVNLVVYVVGRLAGGEFTFTRSGSEVEVGAVTVAIFSALPLGIGLVAVALLVGRLPVIARVAMVVAPLLAVVTIFVMTIPVDLDTISTITLAACHLTLVPISLVAIQRLRGAPA